MNYVEVILPIPLSGTYTYTTEDTISVGDQVWVSFGRKKFYAGIVVSVDSVQPQGITKFKKIEDIVGYSVVSKEQLTFWKWISNYYCASIGDVYRTAVPSILRMESETLLSLSMEASNKVGCQALGTLFADGVPRSAQAVRRAIPEVTYRDIQLLLREGILVSGEYKKKNKKQKYQKILTWNTNMASQKLTKRQCCVANFLENKEEKKAPQDEVLHACCVSKGVISLMIERGFLFLSEESVSEVLSTGKKKQEVYLSDAQQQAYSSIQYQLRSHTVVLLHGVSSSGKTEIYSHLIQRVIESGKQVLYLAPEIFLTTQLAERLSSYFGRTIGIYHSGLSENERIAIYQKMQSDMPYQVILGVRSSLFLPFSNLGLIIVDEEHDSSYKQTDVSPRYNARDAAIAYATTIGAKVVLGSSTPSLESFVNAKKGKYGLVTLLERFGGVSSPKIQIVDMRSHRKSKCLSNDLTSAINGALTTQHQVILLKNHRGYAKKVECPSCGYIPVCTHCNVALTYHETRNLLECHHCGRRVVLSKECPQCGTTMELMGYGTERVVSELEQIFPMAKVERIDIDISRKKKVSQRILSDFSKGDVDILVGTQLISKGLDFKNTSVVGILDADSEVYSSNFRAMERAFQLFLQTAGRVRAKSGQVFLQTYQPWNPIFSYIRKADYTSFFSEQIVERQTFSYPPFVRLISVSLRHKRESILCNASEVLVAALRKEIFWGDVLGPEEPIFSMINLCHIRRILLKIPRSFPIAEAKEMLQKQIAQLHLNQSFHSLRVSVDVDPIE